MSAPCPICGTADAACGHTPLAFPPITAPGERSNVASDGKIYLPRQKVKFGRAGYKGANVVVVDPDTGKTAPAEADQPKKKK